MEERKAKEEKDRLAVSIIESVDFVAEAYGRLSTIEKQLETGQTATDPDYLVPDGVKEWDSFITEAMSKLLFTSLLFGPEVEAKVNVIYKLLTATRSLLLLTSKYKNPTEQDLSTLFMEPQALTARLNSATTTKERWNVPLKVIGLATPAFGCLFTSDCGGQLGAARKAIDEFFSKSKGIPHAMGLFADSLDTLVAGIEAYMDDKHLKGGLLWTGSLEVDASFKLCTKIHGSQGLVAKSEAPSKAMGTVYSKHETWLCQFWCKEKGPLTCVAKERDCTILRCMFADISFQDKTGHVVIEGCVNTTVTIPEALGNVTVRNCTNVEVVCDVVSTIVIEATNGCRLVLSDNSIAANITACATSDLVIVAENIETSVPTMIEHQVNNGKVSSSTV